MPHFHPLAEYIFYDILEENPDISLRKMFGETIISYEKNSRKILFIFSK